MAHPESTPVTAPGNILASFPNTLVGYNDAERHATDARAEGTHDVRVWLSDALTWDVLESPLWAERGRHAGTPEAQAVHDGAGRIDALARRFPENAHLARLSVLWSAGSEYLLAADAAWTAGRIRSLEADTEEYRAWRALDEAGMGLPIRDLHPTAARVLAYLEASTIAMGPDVTVTPRTPRADRAPLTSAAPSGARVRTAQ